MSGFLDEDLNYVNAPFIARERGISITEKRSRESSDYINTLTLTVRTGVGEHEVSGAVLGNRALRLIRIDGYRVEAVPEGYFLMLHNRDVPGVVGAVGTMLGQANINIGGLELGRDRVGGTALSIFEVDEPGIGRRPRQTQDPARDHGGVADQALRNFRAPRASVCTCALRSADGGRRSGEKE